ncbi:hypothetical protein ACSNOI_34380 [Actinomadura kijaniata]|uniref:hypothetical protein n=1 Tax=Actinomadura kijaniata TaxID=46161 RepID=UPI003F1B2251
MSTVEYGALLLVVGAVIAAFTLVAIPEQFSGGVRSALCAVFGGDDCEKPGGGRPVAGPSSGSGADPYAGAVPGSPEQAAYDKAKKAADDAQRDLDGAEKEFAGLKDELWQFLKDLIGITEAEKCLKEGDIIACLELAANAVPWGKAFKLLRKLPKAFKLARRFKEIWDRVADARKKRDDAQRALKKAEDDLRKKKEPEQPKDAATSKKRHCPVANAGPNSRTLRPIAWRGPGTTVTMVHRAAAGPAALTVRNPFDCGMDAEGLEELVPLHGLDPSKMEDMRKLSDRELLEAINNPADGGVILVKDGKTIMNGHHRIAELLRRVREGRIPANTRVRIEPYRPDLPQSGFWD